LCLCLSSRPSAQLLESLTVTLLPASVSFTLTSDSPINAGNVPLTAVTSWSVLPIRSNVSLYAYFSSSSSALVHSAAANTVDIPSGRVEVSINGGSRLPFDQTVAFGAPNAGRRIFSQSINLFNLIGNRSDTLSLNINLNGHALPADTYTGALRVRAVATP
jgi:hypothetical protein